MNENNEIKFEIPAYTIPSIIKVIGVGGGGGNAVNHMYQQGIRGVDFMVCNTDAQALENSKVPLKIQLGSTLTGGRGAGSIPDVGKNAAIENIDEIKEILKDSTKMVFITAGMGGGTGTGAAPVIAATAREMGILTVGIVTIPFTFEGKKRVRSATDGLEELRKNVDTLLVISNDKLREIFGNLGISAAFAQADNILTTAAKGIAEIITAPGQINIDFADVHTVMKDGGIALMGAGTADGSDRAMRALRDAMNSPLLNDSSIYGAKEILVNIAFGEDISMDEFGELMEYLQDEAGGEANVFMGTSYDPELGGRVNVTLVATGIETSKKDEPIVVFPMGEPQQKNSTEKKPEHAPVENSPVMNTAVSAGKVTEKNEVGTNTLKEKVVHEREELQMELHVKEAKQEEDIIARQAQERMQLIKRLSLKIQTPASFEELEETPAFERRHVKLDSVPKSGESSVSRYTLNDKPDENKLEIRPNNSFLHDNVD